MSLGQADMMGGARQEPAAKKGMSRAGQVAFGLCAVWAFYAAALLLPGGLAINRHEGDAIHLVAMVMRMAEGQVPHLDFMTPIGVLALAPIAGFVSLGAGLGQAVMLAQVAVAAALLPALWWVGVTRFRGVGLPLAFGALALILALALVHGGTTPAISVSMHYNRWAWAIAFPVIVLALMPARAGTSPVIEGVILGLCLAVLAMMKITYAVGLLPAVFAALALRGAWRTFAVGLATGMAVLAVVTLAYGAAFWPAYLGDLLEVARSEGRSAPGLSLIGVLTSPAYLGVSLLAVLSVMALRWAGHAAEAVVLLLLLPGLALITWQNFGNDPQWLPVLALCLLALRPAGEAGQRFALLAGMALIVALPGILNTAISPLRHMSEAKAETAAMFPALGARHADFRLAQKRVETVEAKVPLPSFAEAPEAAPWGGAPLPVCDISSGGVSFYQALAAEVEGAGFAGRPVMTADMFHSLWLFGDLPALPGGAPWYYGGLPGGDAVEAIVVPLCPVSADNRRRVLEAAEAAGWGLREVHRGLLATIVAVEKP